MAIEHNGLVELPWRLQPGDRIRVTHGPLMGLSGLCVEQSSHERVTILLSLLGAKPRVAMAALSQWLFKRGDLRATGGSAGRACDAHW